MTEERRKSKRLPLEVSIQLDKLEADEIVTLKYLKVDVFDLSRTGIGFTSDKELPVGAFYDTRIQIWTKEIIDAVVQIVRVSPNEKGNNTYGCEFVGMTDTDKLKIDIYQMFNE